MSAPTMRDATPAALTRADLATEAMEEFALAIYDSRAKGDNTPHGSRYEETRAALAKALADLATPALRVLVRDP